ncbi:MAG: sporulation protein YqfD [Clostridia bacterium]|nr:sporulation protein YqfD [Clostridia bacterium]
MIKNRTKVTIKGFNQERTLNQISQKIKIYNFKREENGISHFEVDFKDRKQIKNMLKSSGIQVISYSSYGLKKFIKNLIRSYGILAAVAAILLCYIGQYNFILKVDVFGQEETINRQIERFTEESLHSRLKSKIDTKKLEILIMEKFDEVSSVSAAIVGQSLVINVHQVELPEELEGEFAPIISQYEGRITKIHLIQGTLAVNEGDIVQKGDILVYPYVVDSQGERRDTHAKAQIYADIWLEGVQTHYDCRYKTQRTGEKHIYSEIFFNNLLIFSNKKDVNFKQYESENSMRFLSKNLLLPLYIRKTIVYEVETIEIKSDFLKEKTQIIENARQKALIFLQENEIIKEEIITIKEESGWHEVRLVLTVNRNIGG